MWMEEGPHHNQVDEDRDDHVDLDHLVLRHQRHGAVVPAAEPSQTCQHRLMGTAVGVDAGSLAGVCRNRATGVTMSSDWCGCPWS